MAASAPSTLLQSVHSAAGLLEGRHLLIGTSMALGLAPGSETLELVSGSSEPCTGLLPEPRGAWSSEAPGAVLTPGKCLGPPAPAGGPASVLTTHVHLGCGGRDLAAT